MRHLQVWLPHAFVSVVRVRARREQTQGQVFLGLGVLDQGSQTSSRGALVERCSTVDQ